MKTVDEGTAFDVIVKFRRGTAANAPTTAFYRIDCRTTKKVLQDWTEVSPDTQITVAILPEWNAIQDASNLMEQKSITVSANKDTTSQRNRSYTWEVKNLQGVF